MARHFSEDEKYLIKKKLLFEGKKLLETYGVKKTSVDKIIEKVSIAKGSFYNFYPSKESLVFDLLMDIEVDLHKEEMKQLQNFLEKCEFPEALKRTVWKSFDYMKAEPLLLIHSDPQLIHDIWSKISENEKVRSVQQDQDRIADFIHEAKHMGYRVTVSATVLSAAFMSFFSIYINQNMIGESGADALELIMKSTFEKVFIK